ncbi:hypothetical protein FRB95_000487 [Tulasnella sp. JGI-2019a]|nr:hypothetical protein FRB95_000487 [Tulasnella sp. JGI-2019a]
MAQVCSTWASIILQTPCLWSLVHFDDGGTGWVTALRRSQSCRIAVECLVGSWKSPEPFWSTIKTQSNRWASLVITAPDGSRWIEFAGVCAPLLEELRIYMSGEQLDIDRANFPNLSAISLTNVGLQDWTSGLLSGLRYLHLRVHLGHRLVHSPSIQQLLDVLVSNPRLEYLRIQGMDPAVDNASIRWPLILLPKLRNIKFGSLPSIAIDVILLSIHATYCSSLYLSATLTPSQRLNIGGENLPNVSFLSLMNVGLRDWSSGVLSGLLSLDLSEVSAFSPSLQQLLDVLTASPHLKKLNISDMAPIVDDTSVRRPPIPLADLRDLSL